MEENIDRIEEECRKEIQAYMKCVEGNPRTWQTMCQTEKENLNRCTTNNPLIQHINRHCGKEFKGYEQCLKENPQQLELCFGVLETFNQCASAAANAFSEIRKQK